MNKHLTDLFKYCGRRFSGSVNRTISHFFDGLKGLLNIVIPAIAGIVWQLLHHHNVPWEKVKGDILTWALTAPTFWVAAVWLYHFTIGLPYSHHREHARKVKNLEDENEALKARLIPKTSINFGTGSSFKHEYQLGYDYRIRVENLSPSATLKNLTVEITELGPIVLTFLPLKLHQMHDNIDTRRETQDLLPGQHAYYDVLSVLWKDGNDHSKGRFLKLNHIVANVGNGFHLGTIHSLTIAAYADTSPKVESRFSVYVTDAGEVEFSPS